MDNDLFEDRMRNLEKYHSIKVPKDHYIILRLDGRSFSKLTKALGCTKPFDDVFNCNMTLTAMAVTDAFGGIYTYVESDEISVLLPKETQFFDREVEKLVSTAASLASVSFYREMKESYYTNDNTDLLPTFDARIIVAPDVSTVLDYFYWRLNDAMRNGLNSNAYWSMVNSGISTSNATRTLKGMKSLEEKLQIVKQYSGVEHKDVPLKYTRGVEIYWKTYIKEGYNPKTKETVMTDRRMLYYNEYISDRNFYKEDLMFLVAGWDETLEFVTKND